MDLNECKKKGFIRKTEKNHSLAKSLIEMSKIKENTVKQANINEENISVYLSIAYESLREILEASCILKGYKVTSHVCLGELVNKLFNDFDYDLFNRFRWIRNGINYYGNKIDFNQGKQIVKAIFDLKKKCLKFLK